MIFRPAVYADYPAIAQLHAQSWQATYRGIYTDAYLDGPVLVDRQQTWETRLAQARPEQVILVADTGQGLAGFGCAYLRHHPQYGTLLDNLHAAPARKGQGIGTELMGRVAHWAWVSGEASLYLWVYEQNTGARRFYDRLGATHAETTVKTNPDGSQAASCRYVWTDLAALARWATS
ncbi:MAG: GNAT family N-acetyltransferase [Bernardetiaceae bacterium]|jgi:GNAT superfamily N-acetyltransferase|nr:GNAT family N-acetyltransferase [Bernardetiaceae bacterium]